MNNNTDKIEENTDSSHVPDNTHLVGPVKHKPFTLPKHYIRKQQELSEILDNLTEDPPCVYVSSVKVHSSTTDNTTNIASSSTTLTTLLEPSEKVQKERRKYTRKQHKTPVEHEKIEVVEEEQEEVKKERKPSAYNVFVKETLVGLAESHKEMSAKNRFALAIQKWNEHKAA